MKIKINHAGFYVRVFMVHYLPPKRVRHALGIRRFIQHETSIFIGIISDKVLKGMVNNEPSKRSIKKGP